MDQTPTQLFHSSETDFKLLLSSIKDELKFNGQNLQGEQRKAVLKKVEMELGEVDDIISQLEIEVQGIPTSIRGQYTTRLRQAKNELTRYRKIHKESLSTLAPADFIPGTKGGGSVGTTDDPFDERSNRTRLLAGAEILEDGSRRIAESTRIAFETEAYGADILKGLRGQREQIDNARDTLRAADTNVDRSHGKIQTMIRQMYKQKVILILIGVVFVALIGLVLYFKLVQ